MSSLTEYGLAAWNKLQSHIHQHIFWEWGGGQSFIILEKAILNTTTHPVFLVYFFMN